MAEENWPVPIEGGCGCGRLRYRLERAPMFIHCCNCQQCQLETGSAFALNVIVEADQATLLPSAKPAPDSASSQITQPRLIMMPTASGSGQLVARCPHCFVAVWSYYAGAGPYMKFIRGGTLDKEDAGGKSVQDVLKPDIYIYTKFKQPWINVPDDAETRGMIAEEYYDQFSVWPKESLERWHRIKPKTVEWFKNGSSWVEVAGESQIVDCR